MIVTSDNLPSGFTLPNSWEMASYDYASELKKELRFNFFHPLRGLSVVSIARRLSSDDVLFLLQNHSCQLVEVHMTWNSEIFPSSPGFTFYKTWQDWLSEPATAD